MTLFWAGAHTPPQKPKVSSDGGSVLI